MNRFRLRITVAAALLWNTSVGRHLAWGQEHPSGFPHQPDDRAHVVLSQALPRLDGGHLKAILVEVHYGPGEASPPHSHPCAVLGYVREGTLYTQVKGEPERVYKAGDTFYEPPHGVHLVSANASTTEPAVLLAYFICDRDAALSIDLPQSARQEKGAK